MPRRKNLVSVSYQAIGVLSTWGVTICDIAEEDSIRIGSNTPSVISGLACPLMKKVTLSVVVGMLAGPEWFIVENKEGSLQPGGLERASSWAMGMNGEKKSDFRLFFHP